MSLQSLPPLLHLPNKIMSHLRSDLLSLPTDSNPYEPQDQNLAGYSECAVSPYSVKPRSQITFGPFRFLLEIWRWTGAATSVNPCLHAKGWRKLLPRHSLCHHEHVYRYECFLVSLPTWSVLHTDKDFIIYFFKPPLHAKVLHRRNCREIMKLLQPSVHHCLTDTWKLLHFNEHSPYH
jgi:hypothetical protein